MLTGFEIDDSKMRGELKKLNKLHMKSKIVIMTIIRRLSHDNLDDGSVSSSSPLVGTPGWVGGANYPQYWWRMTPNQMKSL